MKALPDRGASRSNLTDPSRFPGVWRGGELDRAVPAGIPTGFVRLDAELPGAGLPHAGLVEVLHEGAGLGELSLLMGALSQVAREGRAIGWIHPPHLPYAPALASAGVPLEACLVVRPASADDALWSADQALRSGACGAVLFWLPANTSYAWLRRLLLAAESGRCLALHFRGAACASQATPAHLRLLVSQHDGQLLVSLPKRRGPPLMRPIAIDIPGRPVMRRRASLAPQQAPAAQVSLNIHSIARHAARAPDPASP